VVSVQRDRAWTSASRLVRATSRTEAPRERRTSVYFYDVVVVLCFLALIVIATLGGVLMLLSWVTATVSVTPHVACPDAEVCARPEPDTSHGTSIDEHSTDEPSLMR
jgi:hypothetical protein